nr:MAG TPA: hypothetical protein [Caudoviricetes sp.]
MTHDLRRNLNEREVKSWAYSSPNSQDQMVNP